ncbi:unnamed protein product [Prorocentrum cordatum]|uniref:Uncharacterized protein n=1 Tax=Prorocentrum cordatum TaxID=2364126 RepID=A0ABN9SR93_9DINO|nr:unnamed protein product [Polarella glacialis]
MTASPVLLAVQTLWPIVLCLEMVHGAWLRAAWCSPSHRLAVDAGELHDWLLGCLFVGACLAVASMVLGSLRCLRVFPRTAEQHRRYLFTRSLQHVVNRWLICYALQVLLVGYALWIQSSRWGAASDASESEPTSHAQWVRALCYHYASGSGASPATCSDCQGDLLGAPGLAWYETGANSLYLNTTWAREHASWAWSPPAGAPPAGAGVPYPGWPPGSGRFAYAAASLGVSGIVLVSAGALLWRNALLKLVFTAVGPLCYFFLVGHVARWKIFGPITSQVLV